MISEFLMQLVAVMMCFFFLFLPPDSTLRLQARSFLIKLITLRGADSEAN